MRRDARAASHEERWVASLKKALLRAGVTVDAIATVVQRAMQAERRAVGEDGEVVSLGDHHAVQLKGAALAVELYRPHSARQLEMRPVLNVQAGAEVQLVFFGKAIDAIPEAPGVTVPSTPAPTPVSDPLTAQLIRSGRILPSGEAVKPAAAKTEASKGLPAEGKAQGEGFLR